MTPAVNGTLSTCEACVLGVVQGLTEFLPVSSSGHLAVVQHFLTPMPAEEKAYFAYYCWALGVVVLAATALSGGL